MPDVSRERTDISSDRTGILQKLRTLCQAPQLDEPNCVSTGIAALDQLLPRGGIPRGSLVEWISEEAGTGARTLALLGVRTCLVSPAIWVVVDTDRTFHPLAVPSWGIPLEQMLAVRPQAEDTNWTVEQCLRSRGVAVTWWWAEVASQRVLRRWKLAAEEGGGFGILFRTGHRFEKSSWSDVRWLVKPITGARRTQSQTEQNRLLQRVRVELVSCRGSFRGGTVELELDHAAGTVSLVSELANSTANGSTSIPPAKAKAIGA